MEGGTLKKCRTDWPNDKIIDIQLRNREKLLQVYEVHPDTERQLVEKSPLPFQSVAGREDRISDICVFLNCCCRCLSNKWQNLI